MFKDCGASTILSLGHQRCRRWWRIHVSGCHWSSSLARLHVPSHSLLSGSAVFRENTSGSGSTAVCKSQNVHRKGRSAGLIAWESTVAHRVLAERLAQLLLITFSFLAAAGLIFQNKWLFSKFCCFRISKWIIPQLLTDALDVFSCFQSFHSHQCVGRKGVPRPSIRTGAPGWSRRTQRLHRSKRRRNHAVFRTESSRHWSRRARPSWWNRRKSEQP